MKKYLGQHFLKNKKILKEIAAAAELSKKDVVLEVGPGHGELTEFLAQVAGKVIAVEKDRELIPFLEEKFKNIKNVKIIQGDILKIRNLGVKNYKIVANIPYYITSHFLRTFLEAKNKPKLMVLMVQYEVAKRILAKPPEMNLLALSVQAYARAKFIRKVLRGNFVPAPKVDSAIVKIMIKHRVSNNEEKILKLAKLAFQQKRKMLRHSLKNYKLPKKFLQKRPQELSLGDWKKIFSNIY
ncbi:MAG: 16S rRNA (adenine(1518)-N(6)/adenine(1519)-N(6))-dimethyltransferase RsmA [bacterium]|nr:16S rRNA (adenine(1518)-N(6)/adenine(1519)-N(6))-dimethyltransferase RsmA [bacterium]